MSEYKKKKKIQESKILMFSELFIAFSQNDIFTGLFIRRSMYFKFGLIVKALPLLTVKLDGILGLEEGFSSIPKFNRLCPIK
jgi:hypothetical protein